jgi:hypothetical protein
MMRMCPEKGEKTAAPLAATGKFDQIMKRAAILMLAVFLAMGSALAAPSRGFGGHGNGGAGPSPGRYNQGPGPGPGPGYYQGGRQPYGQPYGPPQRQDAVPGGRRMSPEDRERLRRDIRDHGGQIYRDRQN